MGKEQAITEASWRVRVERLEHREQLQQLRPESTEGRCRLTSGAQISRQLISVDYLVSSISSSWIILNKTNVTFHQVAWED